MDGPSRTILLIEHDEATRNLYSRELGKEYHVVACPDGSDAWRALYRQAVHAVVLEPGLADSGGWELLAALKHGRTRSIPVILCSTLDERRRGLELGAWAYLVKPVLPATLLRVVRDMLVE
jgi:DNA-binding response OmpR family regulator